MRPVDEIMPVARNIAGEDADLAFPDDISLTEMVDLTKLRWRIERDYQDLKQEVGLGHYEGRGWRGFHHHATPVSFDDAPAAGGQKLWLGGKLFRLVAGNIDLMLRARRRGVRSKFVNGCTLLHNEVGRMIFVDFLPQALASGRYRAAPDPMVVGAGLLAIPDALERQRRGVSARKIVVTL